MATARSSSSCRDSAPIQHATPPASPWSRSDRRTPLSFDGLAIAVVSQRNIVEACRFKQVTSSTTTRFLELIGKGVQGEVYRARGEKLGRDGAIKVLPNEFAESKQRLVHFTERSGHVEPLPGISGSSYSSVRISADGRRIALQERNRPEDSRNGDSTNHLLPQTTTSRNGAYSGGGTQLEVVELDVTSDESVDAAIAQTPEVDVVINNAGVGYGGPIEAFTSDDVTKQLDVNIVDTFRVAKAVLPGMRARRSGLIIQVSSVAGRCAFPGCGTYHASKWGLEGLSESMRYELGPLGIDVVVVKPGPFSTNFFGRN